MGAALNVRRLGLKRHGDTEIKLECWGRECDSWAGEVIQRALAGLLDAPGVMLNGVSKWYHII